MNSHFPQVPHHLVSVALVPNRVMPWALAFSITSASGMAPSLMMTAHTSARAATATMFNMRLQGYPDGFRLSARHNAAQQVSRIPAARMDGCKILGVQYK